jgi:hypothetical protein
VSVHTDRHLRFATLIAAILCASNAGAETPPPAPSPAAELPQRRPGLWRITTISPEVGLQTHEVCIEVGDGVLGAARENCAKPKVESAQGEFIVTFSCDLHGAREVTSLLLTGDFTSWYRAQSKITLTQAGGVTRERSGFTIDAKFLGPECPKPPAR